MYGIAYVIIPAAFTSLQEELDRSLDPFRRGGPERFGWDKLAFEDAEPDLIRLFDAPLDLEKQATGGLRLGGIDGAASYVVDASAVLKEMDRRGVSRWRGTFRDAEPDFDRFVTRFTRYKARDERAGGYGRWLNPIGRWDWWDLGGRFDGRISGGKRRSEVGRSTINSGASSGRDLVGGLVTALGGEPALQDAEIEANLEPVDALAEAARLGEDHAVPTTVVLPVTPDLEDRDRWVTSIEWQGGVASGVRRSLGAGNDESFAQIVTRAYGRCAGWAAAGVAFHF
ncbi:hypothetical protein [Rhodoplanes azumiensis]|uniref:Uncharacterized protein n=1 Tax=Rhodoplanes azumiensis TaxID=1897628 RepID=A0ABW5AM32_9BRAD